MPQHDTIHDGEEKGTKVLEGTLRKDSVGSTLLDFIKGEDGLDKDKKVLPEKDVLSVSALMLEAALIVEGETDVEKMNEEELINAYDIRSKSASVDHLSIVEVLNRLVPLLSVKENYILAEIYLKKQVAMLKIIHSTGHPEVLTANGILIHTLIMIAKYREASLTLRTHIMTSTKTYGPDHLETLAGKGYQAACLSKLGKESEAAAIFREILSSLERNSEAGLMHHYRATISLGEILMKMESFGEAEGVYESLVQMGAQLYPGNDAGTLLNGKVLASLKYRLGKLSESEGLFKWVLEGFEAIYGYQHEQTLAVLTLYADLLYEEYKLSVKAGDSPLEDGIDLRAVNELYGRILSIQQNSFGEMSKECFPTTLRLGESNRLLEEYETAVDFFNNALTIAEATYGPKHKITISTMSGLAGVMIKEVDGDFKEENRDKIDCAAKLLHTVLIGYKSTLGPVHEETIKTILLLSSLYTLKEMPHDAVEMLERAHNACARSLGKEHTRTLTVGMEAAKMQLKTGDINAAEEMLLRVVFWRRSNLGDKHIDTLQAICELATVHSVKRNYGEGRALFQEVLSEYEKVLGERNKETIRVMQLFIRMQLKVPDLPAAIGMIHSCLKRTIMAYGSCGKQSVDMVDLYTSELISIQQYTDADAVYMKLYNSIVAECGQNNFNTANIAIKIGSLHRDKIKNYNFAASMFQKAGVAYSTTYGEDNELTVMARDNHEDAVARQKEKTGK
jgi:tetratricopeptide (TPR) repeat protein